MAMSDTSKKQKLTELNSMTNTAAVPLRPFCEVFEEVLSHALGDALLVSNA